MSEVQNTNVFRNVAAKLLCLLNSGHMKLRSMHVQSRFLFASDIESLWLSPYVLVSECEALLKAACMSWPCRIGQHNKHWAASRISVPSVGYAGHSHEASRIAAKTHKQMTAFLSCASACPVQTLRKLSPVFLSRLYHHLGDGSLPRQPSPKVSQSSDCQADSTLDLPILLPWLNLESNLHT